jgi:hypothetical protein
MTEWSIAVTVGGPQGHGPFDEAVEAISDRLSTLAPSVAVSPDAVTVRVAIEAADIADAVKRATDQVRDACRHVGWTSDVRDLEATEWSFFETKLAEPTYPELVGITEIADLLGTSRQRASELARTSKFPSPLAELAAGPVWLKPTISKFVSEWERKPGRPRSKTARRLEQIIDDRRAREVEGTREH